MCVCVREGERVSVCVCVGEDRESKSFVSQHAVTVTATCLSISATVSPSH